MGRGRTGVVVGLALLAVTAVGAAGERSGYAGGVIRVDRAASRIVVADMGPAMGNGKSEIAERTIVVTPSTEFVKVTRASGAAPSGYVGDFVETRLPAWGLKTGDWVAVAVKPGAVGAEAVKITVVDTSQP